YPNPARRAWRWRRRVAACALTRRGWYNPRTREAVRGCWPGAGQGLRAITSRGRSGGARFLERRFPMRSSSFVGKMRRAAPRALALVLVLTACVRPADAQSTTTSPFPIPYILSPESRYEEGCFGPC